MATGSVAAVVLAGGSGTRVGSNGNKAYIPLAGRSLVSWSLNLFGAIPAIGRRILVIRPQDRHIATEILDRELENPSVELVEGGPSRHGSEWQALNYLRDDIERGALTLVLVHDAARPLLTRSLVQSIIETAARSGGAVPGMLAHDVGGLDADGTLRLGTHGSSTGLIRTQTPQAFRARSLLAAYEQAAADGYEGTDTSATVERYCRDIAVRWVEGDERNLKVTFAQDVLAAERILAYFHYDLASQVSARS